MTTADSHMVISRQFIHQAEEELESGDFLQASEKAWGAVAHRLKAIARQQGWRHGRHGDFYAIAIQLGKGTDRAGDLERLLSNVDSLHANFYNAYMSESEVREGLDRVKMFLAMLDRIV